MGREGKVRGRSEASNCSAESSGPVGVGFFCCVVTESSCTEGKKLSVQDHTQLEATRKKGEQGSRKETSS